MSCRSLWYRKCTSHLSRAPKMFRGSWGGNEVGAAAAEGYFLLQRDHTCVPSCPRDFYGLASAKTCVTCAGAAANSTSCPGCAAGRWGSQSSLSGCTKCEPGKYAGGGDKASCEFCPRGWHGLNSGVMSECTPCTAGTWDRSA